jgi:two-component system cell cycle response regulator
MSPEGSGTSTPTRTRVRVLVADDSRVIRKAVTKILGDRFDVVEAEDGEDCWTRLEPDDQIEVLITDIDMPRLDGYGLICRVRAAEEGRIRDLPVIVITGAQDDLTRERAFACGATDFITKPIDGVQLLSRARAHAKIDQARRLLSEETETAAQTGASDGITGLHSRRYLLERGAQDFTAARRHERELSIIRMDVDQFADIVANHGEAVAQQVLRFVGQALKRTARTEDTLARLIDSEFAILAPATSRMDAAVLCERVRAAVSQRTFNEGGVDLPLTVSLGLATQRRDPTDTFEELLHTASQRLTLAKAQGGNRLGVGYEDQLTAPEEAVMEQPDLERAIEMLVAGDGGKLIPYLPDLVQKVMPLIEFGHRNLDFGSAFDLDALKKRLSRLK